MLLESAIFLHPSMAAYVVGEMATATKQELQKLTPQKIIKKADDDEGTITSDGSDEEIIIPPIAGAIEGDGDAFDPFSCDDDNPCPTAPFQYECQNNSCNPILPKRSVSNSSIKEAMLADWNCYIQNTHRGGTLYCKSDWPYARYPVSSYGSRTAEKSRIEIGRAGEVIPDSLVGGNGPASSGGLLALDWFGGAEKTIIPMNIDWINWKEGWKLNWEYLWAGNAPRGASVGANPHDVQRILPSGLERCGDCADIEYGALRDSCYERCIPDYAIGVKPRKSNYTWDTWLSHEWRDECKVSWSREVNFCNWMDNRCHFRCKYRAYFIPDPADPRFVADDKGQRKNTIYGTNAQANGVQPHTLLIEIEGQDTTDCWSLFSNWGCGGDSSFSPAAGDEYSVKVYRYTSGRGSDNLLLNTRVTADGSGKAIFTFPLPKEGLYQVVIDHEVSGNGCIVKGPNVNDYLKNASPYHVNFGFFVSPPPVKRGCTETDATNYDNTAIVDDGSCYGGSGGGFLDWFTDLLGNDNSTDTSGTLDTRQNVDSVGSNFSMGLVVASAATIGVIALMASGNGGED